jgi:hypothetical protein
MWLFIACVLGFYVVLAVCVFCFNVFSSIKTYAEQPLQGYDIELEVWQVGSISEPIQERSIAWEINRNETLD